MAIIHYILPFFSLSLILYILRVPPIDLLGMIYFCSISAVNNRERDPNRLLVEELILLVGPVLAYVYFVEAEGLDTVKIGYSKSPWSRLDNLRTSSPVGLRMLWLFKGTRAVERLLHFQFQNHRVRGTSPMGGEWFRLSAVIEGFRYYGLDPERLIPAVNRGLLISGVLPPGLLPPEGALQEGSTEMEEMLELQTSQSRARQERIKAKQLRQLEEYKAKKIQKERQREEWKKSRREGGSPVRSPKVQRNRPLTAGDHVGMITVLAVGEAIKCRCRCGFVFYKSPKVLNSGRVRSCNECRNVAVTS